MRKTPFAVIIPVGPTTADEDRTVDLLDSVSQRTCSLEIMSRLSSSSTVSQN